jgi:hypothetical protein
MPLGAAPNADGNGDSTVDGQDFLIWQRKLGASNAVGTASSVPEPATAVMLACGLALVARNRSRRQSQTLI